MFYAYLKEIFAYQFVNYILLYHKLFFQFQLKTYQILLQRMQFDLN